jgi:hypothetical protein
MTHSGCWLGRAATLNPPRCDALGQCQATTRNLASERRLSGPGSLPVVLRQSRTQASGPATQAPMSTVQLNYVMNLFLARNFIAWNNKLNYHEIKNHTIPWNTAAVKVVEIALTLASWSLFDDHCLTDMGSRSESSCQCAARASR